MNRNRLILVFFILIALLVPLGPAYAGDDSVAGEPPADGMIPCERAAGADGVDEANTCPPNPPPPPPPPPPPDTPDHQAYGWHGEITESGVVRGWACDPNDFNYPIHVHFYADNGRGWHGYIGQTQAGGWWNWGVADACGGNPWHGYEFRIPDWIRNGEGYQLYSYAINICGSSCYQGNPRQYGDGAIFGFGVPADLETSPTLTPNGYPESAQWLANDPVCGSGWVYKYGKTMTVSRGLGLWHRKLKLYTVWCANGARTRITGFRTNVWTEHGSWCQNTQGPYQARTDGGVGANYVEVQATAYVKCASWPFEIPSFNRTLMMRIRFYADRRIVTQDYIRA
jgi:hypothetical protein